LSHCYLNLVLLRLKLLSKSWKHKSQVLQQNWSKQEVICYVLRSTNLLYLFGTATAVGGIYNCTKTDFGNHRGVSLLPTTYQILSSIYVWRLTPYVGEIVGSHQCGFWCNRSSIDQLFRFHQILESKFEYNGTVHQLFIDFEEMNDSVRREVLSV
jgi:hypothetical protein